MAGRFDSLINPQLSPEDENTYPEGHPRNMLADVINPLELKIPFADKLGLNEQINIPKVSKADDIRYMQELPENLAGAFMGGTRAAKELGQIWGKIANKIAGEIPDLAPQVPHIENLKLIQDMVKNPDKYTKNTVGHFNEVYIPEQGSKVIKKSRTDEFPIDIDQSVRDQLVLNDLKHLAPETKTYRTDKNLYQVQEKLQEYGNKQRHYKHDSNINPKVREARDITNERIEPEDLFGNNIGVDPQGNVKFMDVNNFEIMSKFPKESVDKFMQSYKNKPQHDLENAAILKNLLTPDAYTEYLKKLGQ